MVLLLAFCKSLPAQFIHAIALSAHFVPLKSLVAVAGVIAFFRGIASTLFALGRTIQSVNRFELLVSQNTFSPIACAFLSKTSTVISVIGAFFLAF